MNWSCNIPHLIAKSQNNIFDEFCEKFNKWKQDNIVIIGDHSSKDSLINPITQRRGSKLSSCYDPESSAINSHLSLAKTQGSDCGEKDFRISFESILKEYMCIHENDINDDFYLSSTKKTQSMVRDLLSEDSSYIVPLDGNKYESLYSSVPYITNTKSNIYESGKYFRTTL